MNNTLEDTTKTVTVAPEEADLRELGFTRAADEVNFKRKIARNIRIAFEHYRVVEPAHIERFQKELHEKTLVKTGVYYSTITFDKLVFNSIANYPTVPPAEVLEEIRKAKELGCFDRFEVATIESVKIVPDPIIFGRVEGCADRFVIAQWGDDVSVEDILRENENPL